MKEKKEKINIRKVKIRRATVSDIDLIVNVQKQDGFAHAYYLTPKRLKTLFERKEIFFIALLGNKVIGFTSLDIEKRAIIHFLSVVKDYAALGIGSLLLEKVIKAAKKHKKDIVYIYTEINSPVEKFIIKKGFKIVGYFNDRFGKGRHANILAFYF
jgi:N-acetylglutamate synthase-like GNAT family acetyltransferase